MPHDIKNRIITPGMLALLAVEVLTVSPQEDACNVTLRAIGPEGLGYYPDITGNSKLVLVVAPKPGATIPTLPELTLEAAKDELKAELDKSARIEPTADGLKFAGLGEPSNKAVQESAVEPAAGAGSLAETAEAPIS